MSDIWNNDTLFNAALGPAIKAAAGPRIGSVFINLPLDALMFGIMICQISKFAENWKAEEWWIRVSVIFVGGLATSTTAWIWTWQWNCNVMHYGSLAIYYHTAYIWPIVLMTSFETLTAQLFYIRKAWLLFNRNWYIVALPIATVLTQLVGGMGVVWGMRSKHNILGPTNAALLHDFTYISFFCAISADLLITGLILFKLIKSKTGWSNTDSLVTRLILTSIESQVPPAIGAGAVCIQVLIDPTSSVVSAPWRCLSGKVYTLCWLFMLNSRKSLRAIKDSSGGQTHNTFKRSQIHVEVERITEVDGPVQAEHRRHRGLRSDLESGHHFEMEAYNEDSKFSNRSPNDKDFDDVPRLSKEDSQSAAPSGASATNLIRHETKWQEGL